ncbi:MAG: SDR family oxidoreductase [Anaerolineaceae bacterium]|nr:SDR family oxidoreductase [Anaerolineaceae bacterium]
MKILIFGARGMLGHQLCRTLSQRMDVWATLRGDPDELQQYKLLPAERLVGNVNALDSRAVQEVIESVKPSAVVNAIGIVKQRNEIKQAIQTIQVNALFPHQLAEICKQRSVRLIHVSTDCVFSGLRGQYSEVDLPDPVDLYGRSKLIGEIDHSGCLTLRTSIIGWELFERTSLLEWFAKQRGRRIKGYKKAIFTGFTSKVLANLIGDIIDTRPDLNGIYQVSSEPISKHDLLTRLRDELEWDDITIDPDTLFLCDRSLISTRFKTATGWQPPEWSEMIQGLTEEWPTYADWRGAEK